MRQDGCLVVTEKKGIRVAHLAREAVRSVEGAARLKEDLSDLLKSKEPIIVSLEGYGELSDAVIDALVDFHFKCRDEVVRWGLSGLSDDMRDFLSKKPQGASTLNRIFPIFPKLETGVAILESCKTVPVSC